MKTLPGADLRKLLSRLSKSDSQRLVAAVTWLLLVVFCGLALSHSNSARLDEQRQRDRATAQAAAVLLAGQSLEGIVAGDQLSMQLLGQQVAALPAVVGVSVQDVESNVLAEVGETARGETFSAPVVLHDSMAGSVTINLADTNGTGFPWASWLLAMVIALPISAAVALAVAGLPAARGLPVVAAPVAAPEPVAPAKPELRVGIYLRPVNWNQLGNQLSRSALQSLQDELAERLQLLQRIYDAQPLAHAGPQQGLGFAGDDAVFRAVCGGLLLRRLQSGARASGLQLAIAVVPVSSSAVDFSGEQLLAQTRDLAVDRALEQDPALAGRILYRDAGWGLEVTGLADPYQSLLDNQFRQLVAG